MTYALATILHHAAAVPTIEVDGQFYDLNIAAPDLLRNSYGTGLMALFQDWETSESALEAIAAGLAPASPGHLTLGGDVVFLTPLQYPRKLLLGGANYYEHMHKDAGKPDFTKADGIPVFFLKPPSTTLVGCGKTVAYPWNSKKFDWEIELAVVMGKRMRRVDEKTALAGVAAYTVGLDLSARDWQMNQQHPWKFDLFTGKAFDTGCPVGPRLVPARFVDPGDLLLRLTVNGVVKQEARSSDMIWSVGEQIAALSEHTTLEPGDILLTGTPAGVGMTTGEYLKVGDRISAEIETLGELQVEVMDEEVVTRFSV
jgi:2-keto-4-pentenoate hydratase/2-oxohepta-3-ene-1,7-dioic acid hydratase in catechol pathway